MNASVRLAAGIFAACLGAAACTTATPTASPTGVESGAPSGNPTNPGTGGPIVELRVTDDAQPAGRYVASGFKPTITLTLDGTWQALNLLDGFFDVGHVPDGEDLTLVQFARIEAVFTDITSTRPAPMSAEAAIAAIKSNTNVRVIETSSSRIGGLDGEQVTVEAATASDSPVFMASGSPVVVEEGRRLWIACFETPDGLLAIMVSGTIARWDAALADAEPVLESVSVGTLP